MRYLVILKRFEIWLLLALVAGLVWVALRPTKEPALSSTEPTGPVSVLAVDEIGREAVTAPEKPIPTLSVEEVRVSPTERGRIVELTLLARSPGGEEVALDEDSLAVRTESGIPVPRFFEPFKIPQTVRPGDPTPVMVKLWLEGSGEALWLDFQGETAKAELPETKL